MKTPLSSVPLINRVSKTSSSSSTVVKNKRIIIHDGFAYFPNDRRLERQST